MVLKVPGHFGSAPVHFLVDSGAAISVARYDVVPASFQSILSGISDTVALSASGHSLDVVGKAVLPITVGSLEFEHEFTIVRNLTVDALLGVDFLTRHQATVDCVKGCLTLAAEEVPFIHTGSDSCQPSGTASSSFPITVLETIVIPGRSLLFVTARLNGASCKTVPDAGLIEPTLGAATPKHILIARSLATSKDRNQILVQVINVSPGNVTLCKGTPLGEFIPMHDVCVVDATTTPDACTHDTALPLDDIDLSHSNISPQEKQQLLDVLNTFRDVFAVGGEPLGRTSVVQHDIQTSGPPIRQPLHRLPVALKPTVTEEVSKMLTQGVIRHSSSPWSSPLVLVKKKDKSWRFCVDYRKLNNVTHRDAYPLPRIDATLDSLNHCSLFTTLDLASGYWQVEVTEQDKEKTAFSTPNGHFEFNVMPFGLTNAPATFQRLMECVLAGLSGEQCLVYIDDIIIFSESFQEHLNRLVRVLQRLREAGLKLKPKKCQFAMQQVTYLGHVISAHGILPDASKIEAVADYPAPKTAKQLKQFLGLTNYYRRFINHYAAIAEPLHKTLRGRPKHFVWDEHCTQAFNTLKQCLVTPPILALPNFEEPFILYTDASDVAIGGALGQIQNGVEHVIAYWSRQLKPAERKYSTVEREALAAVSAIKDFYPYLYGHTFTLVTDHHPLTSLKNLNDFGDRLTHWSLFLQQFDFKFQYKRDSTHTNADALFRQPPTVNLVTQSDYND